MPKYKQSFLERLTGTMRIDDDTEEIENVMATEEEAEVWEERHHRPQRDLPVHQELPEETPEDTPTEEEEEGQLAIDMYETDNELIIQSMIAGVTPENLNITITRDTVSIRGKRVIPGVDSEQYIEKELFWGTFSRSINLPYEIDTEGAEAIEKYGLLIIRLPKVDTTKSAELKVKSV